MDNCHFRDAEDSDDDQIQQLLRHLNPEATSARWNWNAVRHGSKAFVASDNHHVVGFALASFIDHGPSNYGMIEELVVEENYRGRGIGKQLLKQCCNWLTDQKLQVVFVSTNPLARSLYLREGFNDCTGPWMWRTPGS